MKAKLIEITHPNHSETLAEVIIQGGVVGALWGHHLYFLACNAMDRKAVERMNEIKGRSRTQVFASPGSHEEAEEFADIVKNKALLVSAKKMSMKPLEYLEFLFKKFPLAVELFANSNAPPSVTFSTPRGKTIWIAGHLGDKIYSHFLKTVRNLRRNGKKVVFAGTSLNLKGANTLTVKDFDQVLVDFGDKINALSVYPNAANLSKLKFSTSSSGISFTGLKPRVLRIGATSVLTLKKYIPDLQVPHNISSTRK